MSLVNRYAPLGVGIIGCGYATQRLHLPALRGLASVRVVAIADTDPERLRLVGGEFTIVRRYDDYETLLRDADVEAVAVCVPPRAHAAVAVAALEARKHVFVEKPLCLDLDDADRLVERARRTPVTAMVAFNLRYHRHVRAARQAIAQGLIGDIELVRTLWSTQLRWHAGLPEWRRRRALGGGVLHELAVHHVDLWRFLLDSEVDEIFASTRGDSEDDHTATLTAHLRNGALALSGFSQNAAESHELAIYGHRGSISASPYRVDGFALASASSFPGDLGSRVRDMLQTVGAAPDMIASAFRGGAFRESYRSEWRHFAEAAIAGVPAESTFDDGRRALEIVLAAVDSSRTRRPVPVSRRRQPHEDLGSTLA
jgi:myo-inositol 2-dehydrogenase / D-chiro-inositol 1-dehydrogenase